MVCAAALASFSYILDHKVYEQSKRVGEYFVRQLRRLEDTYPLVKEVRGRGMLLAMEFYQNCAMDVVTNCLQNGLLLNPVADNAIRFMPPLIVTERGVDEPIGVLDPVLSQTRVGTPA